MFVLIMSEIACILILKLTLKHYKKHTMKNLNWAIFWLFIEILMFHILELQITLVSFIYRFLWYFPQVGNQCFRINSYNSLTRKNTNLAFCVMQFDPLLNCFCHLTEVVINFTLWCLHKIFLVFLVVYLSIQVFTTIYLVISFNLQFMFITSLRLWPYYSSVMSIRWCHKF